MSTLYPRLLPSEAGRLFSALGGREPEELRNSAAVSSGRAVFAATGGTRVTRDELQLMATELEKLAIANSYPYAPSTAARNDFDLVGRQISASTQRHDAR